MEMSAHVLLPSSRVASSRALSIHQSCEEALIANHWAAPFIFSGLTMQARETGLSLGDQAGPGWPRIIADLMG